MTDTAKTTSLDGTISALQQDLGSISSDDAISIIESWQQQLSGDVHEVGLAQDLAHLKAVLLGEARDVSLTDLLSSLSKNTAQAANGLNGDLADKVNQLAAVLSDASASIKG